MYKHDSFEVLHNVSVWSSYWRWIETSCWTALCSMLKKNHLKPLFAVAVLHNQDIHNNLEFTAWSFAQSSSWLRTA